MTKNREHLLNIHIPAHLLGALGVGLTIYDPSWYTAAWFLFFWCWFSGLGQSIGFHRYFTHRAFKTNRFWHIVMLVGGSFAAQGSVVFWVALHRMHHPHSDDAEDIHSPRNGGFWHAYMGWIFSFDPERVSMRRAGDLIRDPLCRTWHLLYKHFLHTWWLALLALSLFDATRPLAAAAMMATLIGIHQEAVVNSMCHSERFGKAPYADRTKDQSRNIWWLGLLTWGQAYHHNHHAWPNSANFRCDEPRKRDIGYRIIRLIESKDADNARAK